MSDKQLIGDGDERLESEFLEASAPPSQVSPRPSFERRFLKPPTKLNSSGGERPAPYFVYSDNNKTGNRRKVKVTGSSSSSTPPKVGSDSTFSRGYLPYKVREYNLCLREREQFFKMTKDAVSLSWQKKTRLDKLRSPLLYGNWRRETLVHKWMSSNSMEIMRKDEQVFYYSPKGLGFLSWEQLDNFMKSEDFPDIFNPSGYLKGNFSFDPNLRILIDSKQDTVTKYSSIDNSETSPFQNGMTELEAELTNSTTTKAERIASVTKDLLDAIRLCQISKHKELMKAKAATISGNNDDWDWS